MLYLALILNTSLHLTGMYLAYQQWGVPAILCWMAVLCLSTTLSVLYAVQQKKEDLLIREIMRK